MEIVLVTKGKGQDFDEVMIRLFESKEEAERFCMDTKDKVERKYWTHAEIIKEGKIYEPTRYFNY